MARAPLLNLQRWCISKTMLRRTRYESKSVIVSKLKCKVYNLCAIYLSCHHWNCVYSSCVDFYFTRKTVLMENEHVKLLHHLSCWNVKSVWWMATSKIKWNLAQIEWQINALFCFSFRKIARVHAKLYTMRQHSYLK